MARYTVQVHVDAPPHVVFDVFADPQRMTEWVEGVTRVTDVEGAPGRAGTTYTVWFGRMRSPTTILESEPPRRLLSRFGNTFLRGEMEATFQPEGDGTRLTQTFLTEGIIPAIAGRIFASGSWRGSFRGELMTLARLVAREAATDSPEHD